MRRIMLSVPLLLMAACAGADGARIDRIDVIDKGIYAIETGAQSPAAGTPTGEVTAVSAARLVEATATIPARTGLEFGFRFIVVGAPHGAAVPLEMVTLYPEPGLREPGGAEPVRRSAVPRTKTIGETEYTGYGFENAWEAVPGPWTFQIWHGDRMLAEERFTVVE